jgi:hypothetical protein
MFDRSVWASLRHPAKQLVAFQGLNPPLDELPFACWITLVAIAVLGSGFYGATLGLVIDGWRLGEGALLLTLSAGLAWCVFGPTLLAATRLPAFCGAHACLVTMAYGEAILAVGAAVNMLSWATGLKPADSVAFNIAWVALSNLVMASTLSFQLLAVNIPVWKTLSIWMLALNGSGFLFFLLLKYILER